MIKIPPPNFRLEDIFCESISHYKNPQKEKEMLNIYQELLKDQQRYISRMQTNNLYKEEKKQTHSVKIEDKDLNKLYTDKLLNKNYEIRKYYDLILTSSSICPYCGKRHTKTVDHFLSKTNFPNYSVTPINLVPCCSDCNKSKDNKDGSLNEFSQLFHPYWDDLNSTRWLGADLIIEKSRLLFNFHVLENSVDEITYKRLYNQFDILELKKYYSLEANIKLSRELKYYIELFNISEDNEELKDHFESQKTKCSYYEFSTNDFEYVYYCELLNNFNTVISFLSSFT
ncbi:HNH endonuclease [Amedibacillus sp. YH-ame6]